MSATKIADIIEPRIFNPYLARATKELSVIFRSGLVVQSPNLDNLASGAGRTFNMPFWNDLTGDAELLSDTVPLTVAGTDADQMVAVKQGWGRAWGANDLAAEIAGSDPMKAIANRIAKWWGRWYQKVLVAIVKALFVAGGGVLRATHLLSIAVEDADDVTDDTRFNQASALATQLKLGDAMFDITAILMHSVTYGRLVTLNQIDFLPTSVQDVKIPFWQGKQVMVDDGMPTRAGTTSGTVYTTLFFGQGVFGWGEGTPKTPSETDRDSLQGDDILVNRKEYILHPQGVSWTGSFAGAFPSLAELGTANKWTKVLDTKDIPLLALEHN